MRLCGIKAKPERWALWWEIMAVILFPGCFPLGNWNFNWHIGVYVGKGCLSGGKQEVWILYTLCTFNITLFLLTNAPYIFYWKCQDFVVFAHGWQVNIIKENESCALPTTHRKQQIMENIFTMVYIETYQEWWGKSSLKNQNRGSIVLSYCFLSGIHAKYHNIRYVYAIMWILERVTKDIYIFSHPIMMH